VFLIGLKCLNCDHIINSSDGGLHLSSRCPECENEDLTKFIRVDDEDIDPDENRREKEWLESLEMN